MRKLSLSFIFVFIGSVNPYDIVFFRFERWFFLAFFFEVLIDLLLIVPHAVNIDEDLKIFEPPVDIFSVNLIDEFLVSCDVEVYLSHSISGVGHRAIECDKQPHKLISKRSHYTVPEVLEADLVDNS